MANRKAHTQKIAWLPAFRASKKKIQILRPKCGLRMTEFDEDSANGRLAQSPFLGALRLAHCPK
jgi:hypothetical protein